jgi:hypothetical protein
MNLSLRVATGSTVLRDESALLQGPPFEAVRRIQSKQVLARQARNRN